ncbi:PTS lactose transporter subunit IIA [Heyndrickxia shackletonii]|uniref:PTS lactose transporter subunit IIA n=1 Tax=Heyndrickxia shackletonii TaxID=157838 RepID=A0A0Q3TAG7_9BACI|nr:PTS lactose/cellobiose transporter subunit IIA [Heyndrickxia shackletonii]KQL50529.1 PTS lactose transporter subunit IIA [Heyndrickxia shackletonii]MBB2481781.1 PTS lactose/cellobiose transporter subunit IIA [Bacillus sp. APMAM]NEY98163.1 PTS lactose/cellobiose transporter subunit IIA [Heyndrickxia shackletonii]RTZ54870.1 PTS lactose/cellobiose transporter subunit IIA [Bacillus sp. SAJ1]
MEQINKEELALISMNVILHAGNARDYVFQAVDKASNGDFNQADELMKKADDEIVIAHKVQTNTLQQEAEGIEIPYSPLFGHAQDTLMTVKSEMNIMREIIKLYKKI